MFVRHFDSLRYHLMIIDITEDLSETRPLDFRRGLLSLLEWAIEEKTPFKRVRVFVRPMANDPGHVLRIVRTLSVILHNKYSYVNTIRMKIKVGSPFD